jgi:hypothetical protein
MKVMRLVVGGVTVWMLVASLLGVAGPAIAREGESGDDCTKAQCVRQSGPCDNDPSKMEYRCIKDGDEMCTIQNC